MRRFLAFLVRHWRPLAGGLVALAALAGLAYMLYWGGRLTRALFLPTNLQLVLHVVEVGLLCFLGLHLLAAVLGRGEDSRLELRRLGGEAFPFQGSITLGSGEESSLRLVGSLVSRRHLLLQRPSEGEVEARDLDSTNGSFLHRATPGGTPRAGRLGASPGGIDLRGRGSVPLLPGDVLELGRGGPRLEVVEHREAQGIGHVSSWAALVAFAWVGLFLGWRANLQRLPGETLALGGVGIDFSAFREIGPWMAVAVAATALILGLAWAARRRGRGSVAFLSLGLFCTLGLVALYPLMPAAGLRYARAAERAVQPIEPALWMALEDFERSGGDPRSLLSSFAAGPVTAEIITAKTITAEPETPALPVELTEALAFLETETAREDTVRGFVRGRAALRWGTNLGARQGSSWLEVTYFRQAFVLLAAMGLLLALPSRWPALRRGFEHLPARLAQPVSRRLVRLADGGTPWARGLRPLAYWDVLCGFSAAVVIAVTLWTPLGTTQGRGKSLYLDLPGLATIQSVELVKALFVLFMAGYFARHGEMLAKAPRGRYVMPYLLAAAMTLALTGVQADLGGLFMLALFLALVFVAATGSIRLVATVPLLMFPGLLLAWWLGLTSIVETRLGIWWQPRVHPLGEQVVQARQLLLSSGWTGHAPFDAQAWRLPDVQGDLMIAALGERFGALGLLAMVAAWFAFGAALLREARSSSRGGSILQASVASLVLVQVMTQVGGTMGLLPLTGVPLPWISQGLTATLVFTALAALALYGSVPVRRPMDRRVVAAPGPSAVRTGSHLKTSTLGVRSLGHLWNLQAATCGVLAGLSLLWTSWLPGQPQVGPRGESYRWEDRERLDRIRSWIDAGLFVPTGKGSQVEVDRVAYRGFLESQAEDPGLLRLLSTADGLAWRDGEIAPRGYLVTNPNRFADRSLRRGWILDAGGTVLAMTDRTGRRRYPLGAETFHPVGYGGGAARALGIEGRAAEMLRGEEMSWGMRLRAFAEDLHQGPEVTLTLRAELQREAYQQLDGRPGAAVVLDARSGAVLAMASAPAFDPGTVSVDEWRRLVRDADLPLRNRALEATDVYSPPGSVFKIVVAAASLLEDGFDPESREHCPGYDSELRVSCAHGKVHGAVDLQRALEVSCNIYFARRMVALGIEPVRALVERLGWNRAEGADLLAGLPQARWPSGVSQALAGIDHLRDRDLARVGYGQGPVTSTPLDIARLGALIGGRGKAFEPRLVSAYGFSRVGEEGRRESVWQSSVGPGGKVEALPPKVASRLAEMLRGVFESPEGTARSLPALWRGPEGWELARKSPGEEWEKVSVAGKTGSAWRSRNDSSDDAWMLVWAPADQARVAVAVTLEDAGEGGKVAGPIAMALLRDALIELEEES